MPEHSPQIAKRPPYVWVAIMLGAAIAFAACLLAVRRPVTGNTPKTGAAQTTVNTAPARPQANPPASSGSPATGSANAAPAANDMAASNREHLAPAGTFYTVDYVAAKTPRGVVGFEPGRTVALVEVHREQGTLLVTDGQYQAEVQPAQITNDSDVAALARDRDAASQSKLAAHQAAERQVYEAMMKKIDANYSKNVDRANAAAKAGAVTGGASGGSPLNAASSPANTNVTPGVVYGSPYSYFTPGAPAIAPAAIRPMAP